MISRRTYLGALGAGVVLAGCISRDESSGAAEASREATADSNGSDVSATGVDAVVDDVTVRKAVAYEPTLGSGGVVAQDGRQYVVASVRGDPTLAASAFAFVAGDNSWEHGVPTPFGATTYSVAGRDGGPVGHPVGAERSFLAFDVPSPLSASNPRIRLAGDPGAEWPLSPDLRDRLAAPGPRFELEALDVPGEVSQGELLPLSVTVTNVSETDGRFLAAAYWPTKLIEDDDESTILGAENVSAGDSATVTTELRTEYTTYEDEAVTFRLRGHAEADREVQVRDVPPPA